MKQSTVDLWGKILSVLKPLPQMTLTDWADEYRRLSSKSSAEPGRWRTSKAPYQREIMNAITDLNVQKVVIMSASQIGKTDGFILNPIGYYMHYDPCPIMVVQPTIQMAEGFSKERLSPMLRDTPVLRGLVNDKSRNSGNTILQKIFAGGQITIVGANSPASLASRPIRVLLADEIDRYPATAGKEGDPLSLAVKRTATFWNKKLVFVSTPTTKGISRIEVEYENSTQEVWEVPCPDCGAYQPLEWAGVIFDKENLTEVNYVCQKCGVVRSEVDWKERFRKGRFAPTFPDRSVRGFHLNALASLFVDWREIVEKFLIANEEKKKGNIELLKVWTNTEMGQTWEEESEAVEMDTLYRRREKYNCEVPSEVMYITAGIDTQDDRFEVEVVGWGIDKENWGIKYQVLYGDLKQEAVWNELDAFLSQTFTRADGAKLKIIRACMDTQGSFFNQVCKYCKARFARGIYAIRGRGGADAPYIPRATKNNREQTPLFTIGVDTGKALIYQSLAVENEGANYCHFPKEADKGYNEKYFEGLTAEKMVLTYKKGRAQYVWRPKAAHIRNEPLDCRNYALAALEISGVSLKKQEGPPQQPTAAPKPTGRRRRSGGVI